LGFCQAADDPSRTHSGDVLVKTVLDVCARKGETIDEAISIAISSRPTTEILYLQANNFRAAQARSKIRQCRLVLETQSIGAVSAIRFPATGGHRFDISPRQPSHWLKFGVASANFHLLNWSHEGQRPGWHGIRIASMVDARSSATRQREAVNDNHDRADWAIMRYPVKSLLGETPNQGVITLQGLDGDRTHALINARLGKSPATQLMASLACLCREHRLFDPVVDRDFGCCRQSNSASGSRFRREGTGRIDRGRTTGQIS
jgi:hypothetical protein